MPGDSPSNPRRRDESRGQQHSAGWLWNAGEHPSERAGAGSNLIGLDKESEVIEVVVEIAVDVAQGCGLGGRHIAEAAALAGAEQKPVGGVYVTVVVQIAAGGHPVKAERRGERFAE